jgi:hypothetical protein
MRIQRSDCRDEKDINDRTTNDIKKSAIVYQVFIFTTLVSVFVAGMQKTVGKLVSKPNYHPLVNLLMTYWLEEKQRQLLKLSQ